MRAVGREAVGADAKATVQAKDVLTLYSRYYIIQFPDFTFFLFLSIFHYTTLFSSILLSFFLDPKKVSSLMLPHSLSFCLSSCHLQFSKGLVENLFTWCDDFFFFFASWVFFASTVRPCWFLQLFDGYFEATWTFTCS